MSPNEPVSAKGLLYLYFKTKEELFKAVVRSFVVPRIDALVAIIDSSELSSEEFLRGPFLDFVKDPAGFTGQRAHVD